MLRRCALLVAAALSPTAALVLLAAPRAPARHPAPAMGFFDQRKPDKMDVSYSVAAILNKDPSAVGKLQSCIKAAEAALKSNPKAKKELGVYRYTDNIIGYGEQGNTVKFRFFGIFSKRAPDVLIPGTNIKGKGSSYSCNIAATATLSGSKATLTKLSCAKDEGWGRSVDVI